LPNYSEDFRNLEEWRNTMKERLLMLKGVRPFLLKYQLSTPLGKAPDKPQKDHV
jgi:hypothetical protein